MTIDDEIFGSEQWNANLSWTTARFHHTKTNCCPNTHHKLHNAKDQDNDTECHFCSIRVLIRSISVVFIIITTVVVVVVVYIDKHYTVANYDYSTKHSRCDGESDVMENPMNMYCSFYIMCNST